MFNNIKIPNTESELFPLASFSLNFGFEGILPTSQFQLDLGSDPSKIFPRHTYHVDTDDRINRKGRSIIFCHNLSHIHQNLWIWVLGLGQNVIDILLRCFY